MIRMLREEDAQAYAELRREMLLDSPLAFASSPADDFVSDAESVRTELAKGSESVIFGAFEPELVGAAGLFPERHEKRRHIANLWGFYVKPDFRGRGLGAQLVEAVCEYARTLPGVTSIQVGVSTAALQARKIYGRAGFRPWGVEPDALRAGGRSVDETHMVLLLDAEDERGRSMG